MGLVGMRPGTRRAALIVTVCAALVAPAVVDVATAQASPPTVTPSASGAKHNVIVMLRDQHTNLAITRGHNSARTRAFASDQSALISTARSWGARNVHGFSTVNAFSAQLTTSQESALSQDSQVQAVYPDLLIRETPTTTTSSRHTRSTAPGAQSGPVCPSDPTKPLLEPEALGVTNTAFSDTAKPQAQNIVDGTGVKVAFLADGLDINNQDFIRADGSHVFVDYQDFSGDGPNAPTSGEEAFGDASAIAAQGLHTYDLANYVNAAHPLPAGCTITVRGMAPGASLIGLKVFGSANSAPTSRFIEAIDYAVSAGVDVLNESFGSNPYPDNGNDPITLADLAAVAAGVTVVASTGDAGTTGTIGSPSSTSGIIGAAASTTFQTYAQTTESGFQFSNGTWVDNNISGLSSGGITQSGRTPTILAPGDLGWALCSSDTNTYVDCTDNNGNGSPIKEFGGTSQASPLTAGAAALVIEAYENTHHGAHPSPSLVERLLTSTATDLGHPAYEQGAGLLNSLAAVQAAESWRDGNGSPAPTGDSLVTDKSQLTTVAYPHTPAVPKAITVTNAGTHAETVDATTRALTRTVKTISGTTSIDTTNAATPFYVDSFGIKRSYTKVTFTVPRGVDRLSMQAAFDTGPAAGGAPAAAGRIILIDPNGAYTAYSIPQGAANYANTDARYPIAGTWTAYFALSTSSGFNGPIQWAATLSDYAHHGIVLPSHFTLAPGASRTVFVLGYSSEQPGDLSESVQFASDRGLTVSVPFTVRTIVPPRRTTFTSTITGGNGRATFGPAQANTYYIQVPAHQQDLSVGVKIALPRPPTVNDLEGYVVATLEGPNGQTYGYDSNFNDGNIQFYRMTPQPGIWVLTLEALNPVEGNLINTPVTTTVDYNTVRARANLPNGGRIAAGSTVTVPVKVTNNGAATLNYYVDPRLSQQGTILLSTINGADAFPLPQPAGLTPQWQVPSQSTSFTAGVTADTPVNMDVFYLDGEPDLYSANVDNSASVTFAASEVSPGLFGTDVGQTGPFGDAGAPAGTANLSASVQGKLFDLDTSSDTADIMTSSAVAQAPNSMARSLSRAAGSHFAARGVYQAGHGRKPTASPGPLVTPVGGLLTLAPGQSGVITVTITPSAAAGTIVNGHLYLDTFDQFTGGGDELVDLPYSYRVS